MLQMYAYLICARTMALVMAQHMANVNAKKTISDFIVNTMVGIMIKCLIAHDEDIFINPHVFNHLNSRG